MGSKKKENYNRLHLNIQINKKNFNYEQNLN